MVGASAGGVEVLCELAARLPAEIPAAVFVVLHVMPHGTSALPAILNRAGAVPAHHAVDGEAVENGRIYIAPPDHHMVLEDGHVRVLPGPRENGHRPAIDPLFRSAAQWYGSRVIGVVLSGVLDDGAAGLSRVTQAGGIGVVQDPGDATYDQMPRTAIEFGRPDHVVAGAEVGELLARLVHEPAPDPITQELTRELEMDEMVTANPNAGAQHPQPGDPSGFTCPECGGALWESEEIGVPRFRCRVGHAYSRDSLLAEQSRSVEAALWAALRALEERAALARRINERLSGRNQTTSARRFLEQAREADEQATTLRGVLDGFTVPVGAESLTGSNTGSGAR